MAEGSASPGAARTSATTWPVTLAVLILVALELAVASSAAGAAARVTALFGLAGAAVALSLRQAFGGLGGSRAMRAAILVPVAFSLVIAVVLMLDAHVRALGGESLAR